MAFLSGFGFCFEAVCSGPALLAPAAVLMVALAPRRWKANWAAALSGAMIGLAITLAAYAVIDLADSPTSYFRTVINPSRSVWDLQPGDLDGFFDRVKLSLSAPQFQGLLTSQPPEVAGQKAVDYGVNLALSLHGSGQSDEAIEVLRDLIQRHASETEPMILLARLLLRKESTAFKEEALALARRSIELQRSPENLDLLGMALFDCGRLDEAEEVLREAVSRARVVFLTFRYHLAWVRSAREK